jgi:Monooxygenase af470-like
MSRIRAERLTANIEGDFVVFLIGMRINSPLKVHKWLPVATAMPRMLKELQQQPDLGFL